ncbi:MAG: rod shape-determining protein MreC [Elusimicrobiota bacterium]|jgi:rod shape-determining protein MreC|nr:rod shape-determining protein MreC [Elusimicrobiota bacterium]
MQDKERTRVEPFIFIVLLFISIFCLIFNTTPYVRIFKNSVYYILYPSVSAASQLLDSSADISQNIKSLINVHQDNLKLKEINQELTDRLYNYQQMSAQYYGLIDFLKIDSIQLVQTVFASVTLREPSQWYQWIIIDKGTHSNIREQLPVELMDENGTLYALGRINEAQPNSSKVALITNPLSVVPVMVKDKNIYCLAEGANGPLLKITYIPMDADIREGDLLVVSNLSSVFTAGTPVAIVQSVSNTALLDSKVATARVLFSDADVNRVIVLVGREVNVAAQDKIAPVRPPRVQNAEAAPITNPQPQALQTPAAPPQAQARPRQQQRRRTSAPQSAQSAPNVQEQAALENANAQEREGR